ncbi:MAG: VanW family protein [Egibacteraceae bacterium]
MRTLLPAPHQAGSPTRRRRGPRLAIALLAAFVVLGALTLTGLRLARQGTLPGAQVADVQVGDLDETALAAVLDEYRDRRERTPVTVTLGEVEVAAPAADLGYRFDTEATAQAVLRRGRQVNPFAALFDHLRAFLGTIRVAPEQHVDAEQLEAWLVRASAELTQPPVEGSLEFDGAQITRIDPRPGGVVQLDVLRPRLRAALLDPQADRTVRAQAEPVRPETTPADVDAVLAVAERALAGPVTLSRDDTALTLSPDQIGAVLAVDRDGAALGLRVDPARLAEVVPATTLDAIETPPVDATFSVAGGTVRIAPSQDGFQFDPEIAAEQVLALATGGGPREAALEGVVTAPDLTTADAEALGVVERVSTYTTEFTAGQSRVTNIHRIADMVDGTLLRPGETFSVNDHVGERTAAKGFVGGGAIFDGEFVEQIGGGVSQFATTMYNAAYFGGYAIPQHKAHSYYISRYPVGREATLNYPNVDLQMRNSSPYGALLATAHTATSVTVSVYGTRWVQVDSITGERTNVTPPPERVRETDALPAGSERVVQSGREGFDITVTRVLTFPDGRVEREPETTRYLPEPRIIERGAGAAPPEEPDAPPPGAV